MKFAKKKTTETTPDTLDTWRAARAATAEAERTYREFDPFATPTTSDLLAFARQREALANMLEAHDVEHCADVAAALAVHAHELAGGDELARLTDLATIRSAVASFDQREADLEAARVALRADRRAHADRARAAFEALTARRAADDLPKPIYVPTFDTASAYVGALERYLREPRPTRDNRQKIEPARREALEARADHERARRDEEKAQAEADRARRAEVAANEGAAAARAREHAQAREALAARQRELEALAAASVAREKGVA